MQLFEKILLQHMKSFSGRLFFSVFATLAHLTVSAAEEPLGGWKPLDDLGKKSISSPKIPRWHPSMLSKSKAVKLFFSKATVSFILVLTSLGRTTPLSQLPPSLSRSQPPWSLFWWRRRSFPSMTRSQSTFRILQAKAKRRNLGQIANNSRVPLSHFRFSRR